MGNFQFRTATINDADILLTWRNDPVTMNASRQTEPISHERHIKWLTSVINDEARELFIFEENGKPVGVCRADRENDKYCLSWTISPNERNRGLGKTMLKAFMGRLTLPSVAEIRKGNWASRKMAEYAGLKYLGENGEFWIFRG